VFISPVIFYDLRVSNQGQQRGVQPLQPNEYFRYAVWPTDLLLQYFNSGTPEQRKQKRQRLVKCFRGDLEARYLLGRDIFVFAKHMEIGLVRTHHLQTAARLMYKTLRISGRYAVDAGTYYGSICHLEGRSDEALFYWNSAANNGGTSAMYQLALLHKQKKNRAEALNWLQKASAKGHQKSQIALAQMQLAPKPDFNLNPRAAELHIEEWMAHWGFHDARATPVGPDGGFDVKSKRAAAQVKFRGQPTPLDQINSFHGACDRRYEHEIFVSKSGYTKPAREVANEYGMALFTLEEDGTPIPINYAAEKIYKD